jgi:urea transport system permease protein
MQINFSHSFIFLLLLFNLNLSAATESDQALKLLTSSSFDDKSIAIELLAQTKGATSESLLKAMAQGDLYYVKSNKRFVLTDKKGTKIQLTDALTGEGLGLVSKRKVKKVSVNNKLRGQISTAISNFKLFHADATIRLVAVENLMANASPEMLAQLQSIKQKESDPDVIDAIDTVTAFSQLESTNIEDQLSAIRQLEGHLNPVVLNQLKKLSLSTNDALVRLEAKKSVLNIESKVTIFGHLETLFFGLSLGSILALAAIGLAITFGVMGVINMAHGELIMIGAYTTYSIQLLMPNHIGASILVAIPTAFLVSALVGILIERSIIRFLYGRPLETLLATFGISLFLQQAVRSIFSPLNRPVVSPEWMSGSLQINSLLSITYNRLYIFFFCLAIFALLYLIMTKTSLGLHVRAISQNRPMARAMGVRSQRVDVMTFGLGSGIAGVAGVALSQITNVGPNLGQAYIVDSFMVVVFGGVGNLWGTLISGLTLGVVGKFLEPATGAVLAKVLVLLFIILYIQKRPRGMFPQKGRAAGQ